MLLVSGLLTKGILKINWINVVAWSKILVEHKRRKHFLLVCNIKEEFMEKVAFEQEKVWNSDGYCSLWS